MIKTIIFDFDNTLYIGDVWKGYREFEKSFIIESFASEEKYKQFVEKYQIDHSEYIMHIVKLFKQDGLSVKNLEKVYKKHIFKHSSDDIKIMPNELFRDLKEKYNLYIVSMSHKNYVEHYCKLYGIDLKYFNGINSLSFTKHKNKGDVYSEIQRNEHLNAEEILVIGNEFENDIKPAIDLGMKTLHFKEDFNQIYDYFTENQILNCAKFKK